MDQDALGPVEGPLMRARLHIRSGKRRLREGKVSAGIVTLYDSLLCGLEAYVARDENKKKLVINEGENLKDEKTVFAVLRRSGALDDTLNFNEFERLVERALYEEVQVDWRELLVRLERVFTQLGVMPFDEGALPPEKPGEF